MFKKSPKPALVKLTLSLLFLLPALFLFSQKTSIFTRATEYSSPIIVDHTNLDNYFSLLKDNPQAIALTSSQSLLFRHASVGGNINDGLNCLANNYDRRPYICDRDLDPSEVIYDPAFDRSNWDFEFHLPPPEQNPGWWVKVTEYVNRVDTAPHYDFTAFKFGYVDAFYDSVIDQEFFNPQSAAYPNISQIEALDTRHPDQTQIFWTMGLARTIGTPQSTAFNQQMRAYALQNNKVLLDMADIESHSPTGEACFYQGEPALCADYTTEINGGHLNARGKLRLAKAVWVTMALASGWDPGLHQPTALPTDTQPSPTVVNPSPTSLPTQQPTLLPTQAPTAVPTLAPTLPPIGDNSSPVISTSSLSTAYLNTPYTKMVVARDDDPNDTLTMSFQSLPLGLSQGVCQLTNTTRTTLACQVTGTPQQSGYFVFFATVTDSYGASVTRPISITVQ